MSEDRRKSGQWDRRMIGSERAAAQVHCPECSCPLNRPERRKDHAMRERFEKARNLAKTWQPHNGYEKAVEAGLRAMYRELKGQGK